MKCIKLAIVIPCYNRPESLQLLLESIFSQYFLDELAIYVSDDSPNDSVFNVIQDFTGRTPELFYRKNVPPLGHDLNFYQSILWATTHNSCEYIWPISDGSSINFKYLELFIKSDTFNHDIFCVNTSSSRVSNIASSSYSDAEQFLVDIGWHATLTGATIYKSSSILECYENFNLNNFRNFPQIGLIFTILSKRNSSAFWDSRGFIGKSNRSVQSYWHKDIYSVFFIDLPNSVFNLPSFYSLHSKLELLRNHSKFSKMLNLRNSLFLKHEGILSIRIFKEFKIHFKSFSDANLYILLFVAFFPRKILFPLVVFLKSLKKIFTKQKY